MKTNRDVSDVPIVLIKRAADGDETAFREIYDMISGKMYNLCLRYTGGDINEANDIFQEGFIKVYKSLERFRCDGSFDGWVRRIFVTACIDAFKNKKNRFIDIEQNANISGEDETIYNKISLDHLMNIVYKLPPRYRTIINLFIIEEYNHREIGDLLGISESSSKSKLHRGKTLLKQLLEENKVE